MKIVEETYWCDICQERIIDIDILAVNENRQKSIPWVVVDVWKKELYKTNHICVDCQNSILDHIKKISGSKNIVDGWDVV